MSLSVGASRSALPLQSEPERKEAAEGVALQGAYCETLTPTQTDKLEAILDRICYLKPETKREASDEELQDYSQKFPLTFESLPFKARDLVQFLAEQQCADHDMRTFLAGGANLHTLSSSEHPFIDIDFTSISFRPPAKFFKTAMTVMTKFVVHIAAQNVPSLNKVKISNDFSFFLLNFYGQKALLPIGSSESTATVATYKFQGIDVNFLRSDRPARHVLAVSEKLHTCLGDRKVYCFQYVKPCPQPEFSESKRQRDAREYDPENHEEVVGGRPLYLRFVQRRGQGYASPRQKLNFARDKLLSEWLPQSIEFTKALKKHLKGHHSKDFLELSIFMLNFLHDIDDDKKADYCQTIVKVMREITGTTPFFWELMQKYPVPRDIEHLLQGYYLLEWATNNKTIQAYTFDFVPFRHQLRIEKHYLALPAISPWTIFAHFLISQNKIRQYCSQHTLVFDTLIFNATSDQLAKGIVDASKEHPLSELLSSRFLEEREAPMMFYQLLKTDMPHLYTQEELELHIIYERLRVWLYSERLPEQSPLKRILQPIQDQELKEAIIDLLGTIKKPNPNGLLQNLAKINTLVHKRQLHRYSSSLQMLKPLWKRVIGSKKTEALLPIYQFLEILGVHQHEADEKEMHQDNIALPLSENMLLMAQSLSSPLLDVEKEKLACECLKHVILSPLLPHTPTTQDAGWTIFENWLDRITKPQSQQTPESMTVLRSCSIDLLQTGPLRVQNPTSCVTNLIIITEQQLTKKTAIEQETGVKLLRLLLARFPQTLLQQQTQKLKLKAMALSLLKGNIGLFMQLKDEGTVEEPLNPIDALAELLESARNFDKELESKIYSNFKEQRPSETLQARSLQIQKLAKTQPSTAVALWSTDKELATLPTANRLQMAVTLLNAVLDGVKTEADAKEIPESNIKRVFGELISLCDQKEHLDACKIHLAAALHNLIDHAKGNKLAFEFAVELYVKLHSALNQEDPAHTKIRQLISQCLTDPGHVPYPNCCVANFITITEQQLTKKTAIEQESGVNLLRLLLTRFQQPLLQRQIQKFKVKAMALALLKDNIPLFMKLKQEETPEEPMTPIAALADLLEIARNVDRELESKIYSSFKDKKPTETIQARSLQIQRLAKSQVSGAFALWSTDKELAALPHASRLQLAAILLDNMLKAVKTEADTKEIPESDIKTVFSEMIALCAQKEHLEACKNSLVEALVALIDQAKGNKNALELVLQLYIKLHPALSPDDPVHAKLRQLISQYMQKDYKLAVAVAHQLIEKGLIHQPLEICTELLQNFLQGFYRSSPEHEALRKLFLYITKEKPIVPIPSHIRESFFRAFLALKKNEFLDLWESFYHYFDVPSDELAGFLTLMGNSGDLLMLRSGLKVTITKKVSRQLQTQKVSTLSIFAQGLKQVRDKALATQVLENASFEIADEKADDDYLEICSWLDESKFLPKVKEIVTFLQKPDTPISLRTTRCGYFFQYLSNLCQQNEKTASSISPQLSFIMQQWEALKQLTDPSDPISPQAQMVEKNSDLIIEILTLGYSEKTLQEAIDLFLKRYPHGKPVPIRLLLKFVESLKHISSDHESDEKHAAETGEKAKVSSKAKMCSKLEQILTNAFFLSRIMENEKELKLFLRLIKELRMTHEGESLHLAHFCMHLLLKTSPQAPEQTAQINGLIQEEITQLINPLLLAGSVKSIHQLHDVAKAQVHKAIKGHLTGTTDSVVKATSKDVGNVAEVQKLIRSVSQPLSLYALHDQINGRVAIEKLVYFVDPRKEWMGFKNHSLVLSCAKLLQKAIKFGLFEHKPKSKARELPDILIQGDLVQQQSTLQYELIFNLCQYQNKECITLAAFHLRSLLDKVSINEGDKELTRLNLDVLVGPATVLFERILEEMFDPKADPSDLSQTYLAFLKQLLQTPLVEEECNEKLLDFLKVIFLETLLLPAMLGTLCAVQHKQPCTQEIAQKSASKQLAEQIKGSSLQDMETLANVASAFIAYYQRWYPRPEDQVEQISQAFAPKSQNRLLAFGSAILDACRQSSFFNNAPKPDIKKCSQISKFLQSIELIAQSLSIIESQKGSDALPPMDEEVESINTQFLPLIVATRKAWL